MIEAIVTCERCERESRVEQGPKELSVYCGGNDWGCKSDGNIGNGFIILQRFRLIKRKDYFAPDFSTRDEKKVVLCTGCQKQLEERLDVMVRQFNDGLEEMFSVKEDSTT